MIPVRPGKPKPAGASFDGNGVNFTLFSQHATCVELCLFDAEGREKRIDLPARTGDIWHGYLPAIGPGQHYGYRVHGPWVPKKGMRFNPAKLLIDPCAHQVIGEVNDDPRYQDGDQTPDNLDSGDIAPKCVVLADNFDWRDDVAPSVPWGSTIIYEAHVRGLTCLHPDLPDDIRGTYAALGHPVMIEYFQRLGITSLELLPVTFFASEPRLLRMGLTNYWGYNPLACYALDSRYASGQDVRGEFQQAVKALHKAGIEVILDVVFNHTAELDVTGPTLSMRGIDNANYYWLTDSGEYENWTGCGNTQNLCRPQTVDWVLDCLRYWVEVCHVDGFRFDLATVMGRTPGYHRDAPLFQAIAADPLLSRCKMIAEPWDIAADGYQVGNFPRQFAEWNDRYRDVVRRFWLQGDVSNGDFVRRFAASSDIFQQSDRLPSNSINLVTAHDGFTLRDLVSFDHKHNEANGEDNRDGSASNYSNNHGIEGLNASPLIADYRRRSIHALLTTLLLSQGTPMLLAGDEHGHSQHGNNNAYCQDNELTWLDWQRQDRDLVSFTAALIHLRRRIPALQVDRWWQEGDGQVEWLNDQGQPLSDSEWQQGAHRLQIRLSQHWLIVLNATEEVCDLVLPQGEWHAIPPFARDDNPILTTVWHGAAHGVCVFQDKS